MSVERWVILVSTVGTFTREYTSFDMDSKEGIHGDCSTSESQLGRDHATICIFILKWRLKMIDLDKGYTM
jgi:hypothetical protein